MYVDNNNKNQYVCASIDLIIYSFIFHRLLCQQENHHQNFSESKIFGIKNILVIYPPNRLLISNNLLRILRNPFISHPAFYK